MQKKERMANLEVLRCVAMMMVVVLHYLGKGGLLPDLTAPLSAQDTVAWLLEAFCIVAVNVYMMISGYFLCESSFKLSRLLTLWVQLWLYSVGIGVLAEPVSNLLFAGGNGTAADDEAAVSGGISTAVCHLLPVKICAALPAGRRR